MAETNNVHNALETLNIADNFICSVYISVTRWTEHVHQTTFFRVKECLRKLIAVLSVEVLLEIRVTLTNLGPKQYYFKYFFFNISAVVNGFQEIPTKHYY